MVKNELSLHPWKKATKIVQLDRIDAALTEARAFAQECGGSPDMLDHYAWTHRTGNEPF